MPRFARLTASSEKTVQQFMDEAQTTLATLGLPSILDFNGISVLIEPTDDLKIIQDRLVKAMKKFMLGWCAAIPARMENIKTEYQQSFTTASLL
jgi:hypothetical protein